MEEKDFFKEMMGSGTEFAKKISCQTVKKSIKVINKC